MSVQSTQISMVQEPRKPNASQRHMTATPSVPRTRGEFALLRVTVLLALFLPSTSSFVVRSPSAARFAGIPSFLSVLQDHRRSFDAVGIHETRNSDDTLPSVAVGQDHRHPQHQPITITRFLHDAILSNEDLADLESLFLGIQMACKTIASLVTRAGLDRDEGEPGPDPGTDGGRYYSMKRLDALSTLVLKNALKYTGKAEVIAPKSKIDSESPAEHQPGVLIAKSMDGKYVACLDPLDGSGNADASICTGTVFGVFDHHEEQQPVTKRRKSLWNRPLDSDDARTQELVQSVLQPAKNMRAAGYCLYSSATVLVFTLGDGKVQGFTLDPQRQEFILTHPNLTIPPRGNVYSCNEANSEGWADDSPYKKYLKNLKLGKGQTGEKYAHRYVGSMVGDIHRTLLYGGMFAYPGDSLDHPDGNLQLLYKSAPMAYVVSTAGGRSIDGRTGSLLEVKPERVHQKTPCFIGSAEDIAEFETYL